MDPMLLASLISGGTGLLGGLLSRGGTNRAQDEYQAMMEQWLAEQGQIQAPTLEQLQAQYINPENVYNYKTQQLGPTAFEKIQADPRLATAQNQVLQELTDRSQMGLTPEDQLVMNELRRQVDKQRKSQIAQLEADAQRRGMGSSGDTEMRKMMAQEALLNQGAEQADRQAAMNFQAKQNAIKDLGSQAYNMRGQQYQEQQNLATARDANQKFNTEWLNSAAKDKAYMAQQLENQRANIYNTQQNQNTNAYQTQFNNQRQLFADRGDMLRNQGQANLGFAQNQAANNQQMWSGLGNTLGMGYYAMNQDNNWLYDPYTGKKRG